MHNEHMFINILVRLIIILVLAFVAKYLCTRYPNIQFIIAFVAGVIGGAVLFTGGDR